MTQRSMPPLAKKLRWSMYLAMVETLKGLSNTEQTTFNLFVAWFPPQNPTGENVQGNRIFNKQVLMQHSSRIDGALEPPAGV